MPSFLLGLAVGLILAVLIAIVVARRTARRVRFLEQQSRVNERLAEIGSMTGGLAHEIKNPLSSVNLNMQLLEEDLEHLAQQLRNGEGENRENRDAAERLGRMARRLSSLSGEIERLRQILEDFLRFAGRMNLNREPIDINAILDSLAAFFEPQAAAAKVHLRTQLDAQPAIASVDEGLLKQAVLNLMINAVKATENARRRKEPHGGGSELIIRTEREKSPLPAGRKRSEPPTPDFIAIHIIDTGPGIPHDRLDRIFHPYFSTHKDGTGLGLPTARRIVEEHGGTLTVHSEPARGSDFTIRLPASDEAESSQTAAD